MLARHQHALRLLVQLHSACGWLVQPAASLSAAADASASAAAAASQPSSSAPAPPRPSPGSKSRVAQNAGDAGLAGRPFGEVLALLQGRMAAKNPASHVALLRLLEAVSSPDDAHAALELLRRNRFLRSYQAPGRGNSNPAPPGSEYHPPDVAAAMVHAALRAGAADVALDAMHVAHEAGLHPSGRILESLMTHFKDAGDLAAMRKVYLYELLYLGKPGSTSLLRFVSAMVAAGHHGEAMAAVEEARQAGTKVSAGIEAAVKPAAEALAARQRERAAGKASAPEPAAAGSSSEAAPAS